MLYLKRGTITKHLNSFSMEEDNSQILLLASAKRQLGLAVEPSQATFACGWSGELHNLRSLELTENMSEKPDVM